MVRNPVTKERIERVMDSEYDNLSRADKRLHTIITNYGSYQSYLQVISGEKVLAGINGGRHRGRKGFGTWEKDKLNTFVSRRQRDSKGRFVADAKTEEEAL